MKWLLKYLKETSSMIVIFSKSKIILQGFVDADLGFIWKEEHHMVCIHHRRDSNHLDIVSSEERLSFYYIRRIYGHIKSCNGDDMVEDFFEKIEQGA